MTVVNVTDATLKGQVTGPTFTGNVDGAKFTGSVTYADSPVPPEPIPPDPAALTHGQQIVLGQNVGRIGAKNASVAGYSDTMTTVTGIKTYNSDQTIKNTTFTGQVVVTGGNVVFEFCLFKAQPPSASSSSGAALQQYNNGNACGTVVCNWCDFDSGLRGSGGKFETEAFNAGQRASKLTNQSASKFTLSRCRIQGFGNGVSIDGWQCAMSYITECFIGDCTSGGGSHMDGIEIYGSDNITVQRCRAVGVSGGQCTLANITNDMYSVVNSKPIILQNNMVLPKGDNAPILIARNNANQPYKRNVSVIGNYWGDNTNFGFEAQLAGSETPMTGLNVTFDKAYFDANQATNTPGLVYWDKGNVWTPNGEGVTKKPKGGFVDESNFSNGPSAWTGHVLGGSQPDPNPEPIPPQPGTITHGSQLKAAMTGPGALGVTSFQVMTPPSRGYWRGDAANEFSDNTPYVYNNNAANKGGVVPAGGMVIDGYQIPANTIVVQFKDFSAGDFYLTGSTSFMWRGCRFRGRSSSPGYFNCQQGQSGNLFFFYNDLGGFGTGSNDINEQPVKVASASSMIAYRNLVSFTTTAFQANIGGRIEITENFISDLTTFGGDYHINGVTHNGGENNSSILRNHIVIRSPDTSGRTVNQTDCVSFFQDFGSLDGSGTKKIDSNYFGGTGYCIYAGMNPGKPASSVKNMVVTNNLITTSVFPNGGANGPIAATPAWGTNGNVKTNNTWADGPNAGKPAF